MSKFYGTVYGSRGPATRTGGKSITAAAQSYEGSVITKLSYDKNGRLLVEISVSDISSDSGGRIFKGTFDEFVKKMNQ